MSEESLRIWHRLGTTSRRAIRRSRGAWGNPYSYRPRGDLLQRLAAENGVTLERVLQQLMDLRAELLREQAQL